MAVSPPNLSIFQGTAFNESILDQCFHGCDAVLSALGTDKNDVLSKSMPLILKAMRKNNIERILTIGTAGILQAKETHLYIAFKRVSPEGRAPLQQRTI